MKANKNKVPGKDFPPQNTESWGILNDGNLTPMENNISKPRSKKTSKRKK